MRLGGSGNKSLHLLDDKSEFSFNIIKGIKYWDMCAAEALIRGRLGIVTDKDKKMIFYDPAPTTNDFSIPNGMLMAKNKEIYNLCYGRMGDYLS